MKGNQLLIATTNPGKFHEIEEILKDTPFELIFLGNLDIDKNLEETETTHEGNAMLKAKHFHKLTGLPTIGEDSGIWIDALRGELGVTTRRWGAGANASDEEWLNHFVDRMKTESNKGAKFIAVAAYYDGTREYLSNGETPGTITETVEAPVKKGIPLSSVFRPTGSDKVYAALTESEKSAISHRGKAIQSMKQWLTLNHKSYNSKLVT
jgi:XTP/dITP diphosphohydrolase